VIVLISLALLIYYAFSYFFHASVNNEVRGSSNDLRVGMLRQKTINLLFAAMRERVTVSDPVTGEGSSQHYFDELEVKSMAAFYANEE
jgi:hypothetical protein